MKKRRRFKQQQTLQDRLALWSNKLTEQAARLPPGPDRDALLRKVADAETATDFDEWAKAPSDDLQDPRLKPAGRRPAREEP